MKQDYLALRQDGWRQISSSQQANDGLLPWGQPPSPWVSISAAGLRLARNTSPDSGLCLQSCSDGRGISLLENLSSQGPASSLWDNVGTILLGSLVYSLSKFIPIWWFPHFIPIDVSGEKGESTHRVVMEDVSFHGAEKKQKLLQGRQGFLRVGLSDLVPQLFKVLAIMLRPTERHLWTCGRGPSHHTASSPESCGIYPPAGPGLPTKGLRWSWMFI